MAGHPTFHVNVIKNENFHRQAGYPTKAGYLTNLGPPPPCKQALSVLKMSATVYERDHCRRTTSGKNTSTRLDVDSRMRQHNAGCILIFFNPQIFLLLFTLLIRKGGNHRADSKISTSTRICIQLECARPHESGFTHPGSC